MTNDLSLRVTALTMATEAMTSKDTAADFNVTDLAQWMYDWLKDGENIDNPKKPATVLSTIQ